MRAPPRRRAACRAAAVLLTLLAAVCVLVAPAPGGARAAAGARVAAARDDACDASRLPRGVTAVYPCAGGAGVFSRSAQRVVVTFIGGFMNEWYLASLRSLVLVHCAEPRVVVLVWANELTDAWFDGALGDLRGPDGRARARLVRYNVTALAAGLRGAEASLAYLHDPARALGATAGAFHAMEPQMLMAHITDVLRMVVLFRFGGVYLDVDILPLRPVHALGTRFAANLGNYDCTAALRADWPAGAPVVMPDALGGDRVTCMCVCFLSFPEPGHALVAEVLERGLAAFLARGSVYGGFGAWVFMDALGALAQTPGFDARPISVTDVLCWPSVLDAVAPQSPEAVAAILRDCSAVHMMGGGHAKKFSANASSEATLFGQVFSRARREGIIPGTCGG